jgi:chaperonin GroES
VAGRSWRIRERADSVSGVRVAAMIPYPRQQRYHEGRSLTVALRVLGDRVLVKVDEAKTTEGGILLPETAREKPQWGTVVGVGKKVLESGCEVDLDVVVGDRVVFAKYGGREVTDGGEEYLVLESNQVYAKMA